MNEPPILPVLFKAVDLVEARRIPYFVMGGIAVRAWGLPRSTFDVDLAVSVEVDGVAEFSALAEQAGFSVPEIHRKGFSDTFQGLRKFSFQEVSFPKPVEVDIFLAVTPHLREALRRRREVELAGRRLWVASPEDILLHKLVAGRPRDHSDIDDILLVQGSVDRAYLRKWAAVLGVSKALEDRLPGE